MAWSPELSTSVSDGYTREDPMTTSPSLSPLSQLSPHTPSPTIDRSLLTATPTPTRLCQPRGAEPRASKAKPPRFVFYALREEDERDIGLSSLKPDADVEPASALIPLSSAPTQFIFATSSPQAALFFAETGSGPGFAGANGFPRSASKRTVAKIDLSLFKGEIVDMCTHGSCEHYGIKKSTKAWDYAIDHQMVLLVGYIPPRLIVQLFDLDLNPLPDWPALSARRGITFDAFTASMSSKAKRVLSCQWAGENGGERLERAPGMISRDREGLASDTRSQANVCWDAKRRLDEEIRKIDLRKNRLSPLLDAVMDQELTGCQRAFEVAVDSGIVGPSEEKHMIVFRNWHCSEDFPYSTVSRVEQDAGVTSTSYREVEVTLRGTRYTARMALHGPAALECISRSAYEEVQRLGTGPPCRHCVWTRPAEFQLLRNVSNDGACVVWPPYFKLFCYDPATEDFSEILDTTRGSSLRDSEHPHVFPSDDVGFAFPLDRLPATLSGLEDSLPRTNVEDVSGVALTQRPLYLVLVVPEGVPFMQGEDHGEAPLYVLPCRAC